MVEDAGGDGVGGMAEEAVAVGGGFVDDVDGVELGEAEEWFFGGGVVGAWVLGGVELFAAGELPDFAAVGVDAEAECGGVFFG